MSLCAIKEYVNKSLVCIAMLEKILLCSFVQNLVDMMSTGKPKHSLNSSPKCNALRYCKKNQFMINVRPKYLCSKLPSLQL